MKNRALTAPALALAALLALTACGSDEKPTPTAAVTADVTPSVTATTEKATTSAPAPTPSVAASGQQVDDSVFVIFFEGTYGATDEFSDDDLVAMAKEACTSFAAGRSRMGQVSDIIMLSDMTKVEQDVALNAMDAGVANYCPEVLDEFMVSGGHLEIGSERWAQVLGLEKVLVDSPNKQSMCDRYAALGAEQTAAALNQDVANETFPVDVVKEVFDSSC